MWQITLKQNRDIFGILKKSELNLSLVAPALFYPAQFTTL